MEEEIDYDAFYDTIDLDDLKERAEKGEEISPEIFFNYVKSKKNKITNEALDDIYKNCLYLIGKYQTTGQKTGLKKLLFILDRIEKEHQAISTGIDQFVFQDDLHDYINVVCKKAKRQPVKLIELKRYEREIPDDVIEAYEKVKDIFDEFYVVFTDYTGKVEREIEQSKKEKDPILFGVFKDDETKLVIERFYYIGDWIDEYCDLTLDRMVNDTKLVNNKEIIYKIPNYDDLNQLREELKSIDKDGQRIRNQPRIQTPIQKEQERIPEKENVKKSFFSNVKTFLTRGK